MQYSEIKTAISDLANRRDLTTPQIDRYVKMCIDRINRKLRATFMEVEDDLTIGTASDADAPADYLATVSLYDDAADSTKDAYVYKSWFDFKRIDPASDTKVYTRRGNKLYFKPALAEASVVKHTYFARVEYPTGDAYEPELFKLAPDLVIYGSVLHALAAFQDDRLHDFSQIYDALLVEVQEHYASSYMSEGPLAIAPATDQEY